MYKEWDKIREKGPIGIGSFTIRTIRPKEDCRLSVSVESFDTTYSKSVNLRIAQGYTVCLLWEEAKALGEFLSELAIQLEKEDNCGKV